MAQVDVYHSQEIHVISKISLISEREVRVHKNTWNSNIFFKKNRISVSQILILFHTYFLSFISVTL